MKLEFLDSLSKNTEISNSVKFRPVGADLFNAEEQTDGQADMMNLTVAFRSFMNAANRNEHVLVDPFLVSLQCIITLFFRLGVSD
jgi:hypothetical protein